MQGSTGHLRQRDMAYRITSKGIERAIERIGGLDRRTSAILSRSINTIAPRARTRAARLIREQVAFPASYLAPSSGRFSVTRKASPANLRATITARFRRTSLARFARNPRVGRRGGVGVQIKPGQLRFLNRAFIIPLRRGGDLTDTQRNLGLAIRLQPGEQLSNKISQVRTRSGLTLLYGPSVQQVFIDAQGAGVAEQVSEQIPRDLEIEFFRQLKL